MAFRLAGAFDPCRNLAASAQVLRSSYFRAAPARGNEQAALRTAFSFYNTGDAVRGFRNGYVERVSRAAAEVVPRLRLPVSVAPPDATPAPTWDVSPGRPPKPSKSSDHQPGVSP